MLFERCLSAVCWRPALGHRSPLQKKNKKRTLADPSLACTKEKRQANLPPGICSGPSLPGGMEETSRRPEPIAIVLAVTRTMPVPAPKHRPRILCSKPFVSLLHVHRLACNVLRPHQVILSLCLSSLLFPSTLALSRVFFILRPFKACFFCNLSTNRHPLAISLSHCRRCLPQESSTNSSAR